MLKISKEDKNILEAFLGLKEPKYISTLDLKYDNDYYYALIHKLLSNKNDLEHIIVEDWSQDIKQKMYNLSKESQNIDDIIYYNMFKVIMCILKKYYDD